MEFNTVKKKKNKNEKKKMKTFEEVVDFLGESQ